MDTQRLKEHVLDNNLIPNILEELGCHHIRQRSDMVQAANPDGNNPTAICVYLNENLTTLNYTRQILPSGQTRTTDIYDLVVFLRDCSFFEALKWLCELCGIVYYAEEDEVPESLQILQFLNQMNKECVDEETDNSPLKPIDPRVLNYYMPVGNILFENDGISLSTQRKWGIGYDVLSQRITLPIRTSTGEIMAIKGRLNGEPEEFEPKYLYIVNGPMSQTLFGYSENYSSLYENDVIVVESEKSVLKLDSWGYNNVVALGSNSLSPTQVKLLISLNPKCVTFMLDKSLSLENTKKNADLLQSFCTMRQLKICYWNWMDNLTLDDKAAPCDDTKEEFEYILQNEVVDIEELTEEEDEI